MKPLNPVLILLLLFVLIVPTHAQDNAVVPQRTPEQEAAKQTEKLQQELNLTPEQTKQVYEINLRYARERQISNTRSEAMERMKNKNNEIQRILTAEQNSRLQTKRYERSVTADPSPVNRPQPNMSSGFRAPSEYRQTPAVRVPSQQDMNLRSTYRSTTTAPAQSGSQQAPQTVRRATATTPATPTTAVPSAAQAAPAQRSVPATTTPTTTPAQTTQPSRSSAGSTSSGSTSAGGRR